MRDLAVLSEKIKMLRDEKVDEDPNSPYNTATRAYEELAACWLGLKNDMGSEGETNLNQAGDRISTAIENARPVLASLDDGVGLLNSLVQFVKDILKFIITIEETDSEKAFNGLKKNVGAYKLAMSSTFFRQSEPPASKPSNQLEHNSMDIGQQAPSAPLSEDEEEQGLSL